MQRTSSREQRSLFAHTSWCPDALGTPTSVDMPPCLFVKNFHAISNTVQQTWRDYSGQYIRCSPIQNNANIPINAISSCEWLISWPSILWCIMILNERDSCSNLLSFYRTATHMNRSAPMVKMAIAVCINWKASITFHHHYKFFTLDTPKTYGEMTWISFHNAQWKQL